MPTFTAQTDSLMADGPMLTLQATLWVAAENAVKDGGGEVPAPVTVRALVDTGASATILEPEIVTALGLTPVGAMDVLTANSTKAKKCLRYAVRLFVPSLGGGWETIITEAPLGGQGIQGLLGRDFLSLGVFVYIGKSGTWSMSV